MHGGPEGAVLRCVANSGAVLTLDVLRSPGSAAGFPDYDQLVPDLGSNPTRVTVERVPLLVAATACATFAEGPGGCARLEADAGGSGIRFRLNREGAQEHLEDPIEAQLGDWPASFVIGCNPRLLAALLEITRLDTITLRFAEDLSPITWCLDAQGGTALLMPMRLD